MQEICNKKGNELLQVLRERESIVKNSIDHSLNKQGKELLKIVGESEIRESRVELGLGSTKRKTNVREAMRMKKIKVRCGRNEKWTRM